METPRDRRERYAFLDALRGGAIVACAATTALLVYAPTLRYGFDWDDYHFVRPYPPAEVVAAWHGTWDATGIERAFYRPLTVTFVAARFALFGFDPAAYHALSLALFALCAALAGLFMARATGSAALGALGAILFASHPTFAPSAVAWVSNQMHLLALIVFLAALLWWQHCRERPARWWLPLVVAQVAALLIKEDGVMLLPCVVALHALHGAVAGETKLPPRAFLVAGIGGTVATLLARQAALGHFSDYRAGTIADNAPRWVAGPFAASLGLVGGGGVAALASLLMIGALLVGVWLARRGGRAAFLLLAGIAVAGLCNAPYLYNSNTNRWHLLALGGVLALGGAFHLAGALLPRRGYRGAIAAVVLLLACLNGATARHDAARYAPEAASVRAHDAAVLRWGAVVAPELRRVVEDRQRSTP